MPRRITKAKPTRIMCPKCGEYYGDDEVPQDELRYFFLDGCGSVLGTVCDGGQAALAGAIERYLR